MLPKTRVAVVAVRYREPLVELKWLARVPAEHVYLINKGKVLHGLPANISIVPEKNEERESYSYIKWMHDNLQTLDEHDLIVFTQANPRTIGVTQWSLSTRIIDWIHRMRAKADRPQMCYSCLGLQIPYIQGLHMNTGSPLTANGAPTLERHMCPLQPRPGTSFCPGATFVVSTALMRTTITHSQLEEISNVMRGTCRSGGKHMHECWTAYAMERNWGLLFRSNCSESALPCDDPNQQYRGQVNQSFRMTSWLTADQESHISVRAL